MAGFATASCSTWTRTASRAPARTRSWSRRRWRQRCGVDLGAGRASDARPKGTAKARAEGILSVGDVDRDNVNHEAMVGGEALRGVGGEEEHKRA
jgi:hypothetical protein